MRLSGLAFGLALAVRPGAPEVRPCCNPSLLQGEGKGRSRAWNRPKLARWRDSNPQPSDP